MTAARDRLIFFVTDRGYLLPSIVAALQAARQPAVAAIADIAIYLLDMDAGEVADLTAAFAGGGIAFEPLDAGLLADIAEERFADGHISKATLARFVLAELIPDRYHHLVYLDGDIQVVGDILPLVAFDVPPGRILAAPDGTMLVSRDGNAFAADNDAYTASLGLASRRDYFNAGVLAFRHDTWRDASRRAMAYYRAHPDRCRYHDQSALNATYADRRLVLDPAFNYMPVYHRAGLTRPAPAIVHFIGPRKPWHPGSGLWDAAFERSYADALVAYPILQRYPPPPPSAAARALSPEPAPTLLSRAAAWTRRRRIAAYLRRARPVVEPGRA